VAIAESDMPNAFAMGRSQKSATVCCTTAILQLLSPAELEAVIGHELTHVKNRDVMVMTLAGFFATVASFIAQFGIFFGGGFGGDGEGEDNSFGVVILVSFVVYAISFLLLRALSRYREFAADRGSAILTGRPSALSSALLKISGTMQRVPDRDLRAAEGLSAFFIFPARTKNSIMNLFSDHPPIEQRLARLQRIEAQLQGTAA
jgi:heat shock protein HtpX